MRKQDVFVIADNVFTPLGKTTAQNFEKLRKSESAVKRHQYKSQPHFAALFNEGEFFIKEGDYTKFEQLLIFSIADGLQQSGLDASDKKTILIISSTKGNISLLETEEHTPELQNRIALTTSAGAVAAYFGFVNQPIVISNACVSGVIGIITGMRLLRNGQYDNAIIVGADVISEFILSGFQSFQALSPGLCKPFDRSRDGLNLGEGAGTLVLSVNQKHPDDIRVLGGGVSNDANHISGPSRTGQELAYAIKQSLKDASISAGEIDFISAHGTATLYNDEMEANAVNISGLGSVPLNSLKGYYGHTLGAAGIIESVISLQSMKESLFLPTLGFEEIGVTQPVNVSASPMPLSVKNILKTSSGFGGCNAAIVFGK